VSLHYFPCLTYGQSKNFKTSPEVSVCVCVCVPFCEIVNTPLNTGYFYNALPDISTTWICTFGVALKLNIANASQRGRKRERKRAREREKERDRGFNGSLYAILNGLCFISHSDDFRPYNGAVHYLVYDQWQYISVLSFGTTLLHLLVLAVEFSAVQFEQQTFAAVICCHFSGVFSASPLTVVWHVSSQRTSR